MTIEKGQPWGEPGTLPADGVVVASDAAARAVIEEARRRREPVPAIGLTGGDLCRTLGGTGSLASVFTVDLGAALIDGRLHWFVAHLVARSRTWSRAAVVMNAQFRGRWNLAPRGHPNDGLLDVFEGQLGVADRLKVRPRLAAGTHLPHPGITQRRVAAVQLEFATPTAVELDGEGVGQARTISARVEPDALKVIV
ncbi:MAG TPA: hypothetical protein VFB78_01240 [Acidimicrobiales bacterium]|nr:hypothetical protein [Acidimicrobiales bacterium]